MLNIKTKQTTSDKVKEAAATVASLAAAKAHDVKDVAAKEVAPVVKAKGEDARDALAPHVEKARDFAATKRDEAMDKAAEMKKAADERTQDAAKTASKKADKAQAKAEKTSDKLAKKAEKKSDKVAKQADKKFSMFQKKADKKATQTFGVSARQDVAYKAAALRGQAQAVAEDKGLTADNLRDTYKDEVAPHLKDIVAAIAAAATTAQQQARQDAQQAVSYLPEDAQTQVARFAPAIAPKKKGGTVYLVMGAAALGGAGYLFWANQQKQKKATAQLSEAAIADSQAQTTDDLTINNPVTNYRHSDDTTLVTTAREAGGVGTAASWNDTNNDGEFTTKDLEGDTRATRRAERGE